MGKLKVAYMNRLSESGEAVSKLSGEALSSMYQALGLAPSTRKKKSVVTKVSGFYVSSSAFPFSP